MIKYPDYPSAKVKKFGIIGTSCAGKTTLVYGILEKLKLRGVHVDGILQQDRRFSFERARLEDDPMAQWSFIANQIKAEADMALRPGVDVIVSDRSPLDFYAYYEWQYGENVHLRNAVLDFCKRTYTRMYVMDPMPYVDDGARLDEKGRNEADDVIRKVAAEAEENWDVPIRWVTPHSGLKREKVYWDICRQIGEKLLTEEELQLLPHILGKPDLLVGGSYAYSRATKFSDLDVYLIGEESIPTGDPSMAPFEMLIKDALGIRAEVRQVNKVVADHLVQQGFKWVSKQA